jgi:2-polyprenyl-6-methoxyphenol hydroxylase-like FAD-dependent oxidoreductase
VSGVVAIDRDGQPLCINARYVVGADGWHSRVAAMTGAATLEHHVPDTTCMLTYFAGIPWDAMELYASAGGYAGVFPTNDGAASIWVITGAAAAKTARGDLDGDEAILALLAGPAPSLAERLRGGHRTDPLRVATRLPSFLRQAAGRGWALVGDAGYQRDAITGHGITDALRDAELLARALGQALGGETDEQAALDQYGAARDAALRPIFDVTNEMATLPSLDRFVELQIALSNHMEAEADAIASYPPLPVATAAAA